MRTHRLVLGDGVARLVELAVLGLAGLEIEAESEPRLDHENDEREIVQRPPARTNRQGELELGHEIDPPWIGECLALRKGTGEASRSIYHSRR